MHSARVAKSRRCWNRGSVAVVVLAWALVSGCTTSPAVTSGTANTNAAPSSFTDRMNALFFGSPARPGEGSLVSPPKDDVQCPSVDVREGASTFQVSGNNANPDATNLRFQASIGQTARECAVLGATMTIKVGAQGRIILGPLGTAGHLDVPMRLALVQEGLEPKTIWTKFYHVPVNVPTDQTNVPFLLIEEDMTIPVPKAVELEDYVIYVGFDTYTKDQPEKKRVQKKTR